MSNRNQTDLLFTDKVRDMLQSQPDVIRRYIRSIHNNTAPRTQYEYLKDIIRYVNYISPDVPVTSSVLSAQTSSDIEDYLEYLEHYVDDKGKEHTNDRVSLKRKLSALRRFYAWLFLMGYIPSDESRKVSIPKTHKKEIVRMNANETKNFLNSVLNGSEMTKKQRDYHRIQSVRDAAITYLMLSTGLRVSECAELDVSDVDMDECCVHVVRKGGNAAVVYFSDEAAEYLQDWLEYRSSLLGVSDDEKALFLSSRKQRMSVRTIETMVTKYANRSVSKHITPHKLRSTFATTLYQQTGDIYLVAETLGHKDINTTKEHYAHLDDERKRANRNVILLNPPDDDSM
jgi:integrase/recombinase XerC